LLYNNLIIDNHEIRAIDLHMHTTVSDGTDTPEEIVERVKAAGIDLFSITDHDDIQGAAEAAKMPAIQNGSILFMKGVEFSCKDEDGKYHVLGYKYDENASAILDVIHEAHEFRIRKVSQRIEFLKEEFGFTFQDKDIEEIYHNSNPGKPHIAKLMMQYGYAQSIPEAMQKYLNKKKFRGGNLRPEQAIRAVLEAGGIPVLAHPSYGDGSQIIVGDMMDQRLQKLVGFGLQGVECYYSGFTAKLTNEMLAFAEKYDLYVSAGSDYHGENKLVQLGETNLSDYPEWSPRLEQFIHYCLKQ